MGLSLRPLGRKITDIFSADTQEDQRRRVAAGQPRLYADQQRTMGNNRPATNPGAAFLGGAARTLNTARAGLRELSDTARMTAANITGNSAAFRNVNEANQRFKQRMYQPNSGLFGAGTIFESPEEFNTLGAADLTERMAANTLATAGEVVPVGRGLSVARQGVKVVPKIAAQGAAAGAAGNIGDQYIRTGQIDPRNVALSAAAGGVLAAAPPVALAGAKQLPKVAAKTGKAVQAADEAAFTLPKDRVGLDEQRTLRDFSDALIGANKAQGRELSDLIGKTQQIGRKYGIDLTNGSVVDRLERANAILDTVGKQRKTVSQGGYVGLPEVKGKIQASDVSARPSVAGSEKPRASLKDNSINPDDPFNNNTLRGKLRSEAGRLFIDEDAEMINMLRRVEKETGNKGLVDQWLFNTNTQRNAPSIANAKMRQSPEFREAFAGLSKSEAKEFDDFLAARAELKNYEGLPTTRSRAELQATYDQLAPRYEQRFQALNADNKKWTRDLLDAGIIDQETAARWLADDDYIRVQRNMEDLLGFKGQGGRSRSFGTTSTKQKRTGSQREILSPSNTAVSRRQQLQLEIQRNKTASETIDVLNEAGLANNLVDANDVAFRREMYKFLKNTKEGKLLVERALKTRSRELRTIQREIKRLQADLLKGKKRVVQKRLTKELAGEAEIDAAAAIRDIDASTIEGAYEGLLELKGTPWFSRIRGSLAAREPRSAALMDEVSELADTSEAFKIARSDAYRAAVARADDSTRHKNTVKRIVNGIPEVWEVPMDIKRVVENVSPYQLGVIAKIVSTPARVFRAGTTALSAPFTVTNYLRDQASSALYSKDVLATHNPANVAAGLYRAAQDYGTTGKNSGELWNKFTAFVGDQTVYDELRNVKSTKRFMRELRRGGAGKAFNMVTNPIRSLEDLNSITEKATRFQNFKGTYQKVLKQTGNEDSAIRAAVQAAYQNSVNFQRAGQVTRVLNLLIPYFNASIQGTRNVVTSFRDRPIATSIKSAGLLAAPTMAITAYNMADAERREIYESMPDYEKRDNFIVILPGARQRDDGRWEGIIKVPKPQGYRELTDPSREITEAWAGGEPVGNVAAIAKDMLGGLTGPVNVEDVNKFGSSFIPAAVKPYVQQQANKDLYTGGKIVPDFMAEGTDDPTKRAFEGTSGTARQIAKVLGVEPVRVEKYVVDTFGSLGRYGTNTADNILAKAGVIPEDQIGGRSVAQDFSRRLFEAGGELLEKNKSEGQKYYETREAVLKTAKLNKNEQAAYDALHPDKTNFLGEEIFNENKRVQKYVKAGAYLQFPKTYEVDKQVDAEQRKRGKPGNPLFDLQGTQLNKVLLKQALPPGSSDPELDKLWKEPWYQDYQNANSKYYEAIKKETIKQGKSFPKSDYPATPPDLQKIMDSYSALPKGTGERSSWIKANPAAFKRMTDQWAAVDAWENKERKKLGLSEITDEMKDGTGGGFGSFTPKPPRAGSAYKYAVSLKAGGESVKPKVSAKKSGGVRSTLARKTGQPKVSMKKSRV